MMRKIDSICQAMQRFGDEKQHIDPSLSEVVRYGVFAESMR